MLGNPSDDVVVMDDFLYAEPSQAVPEPSSLALAGLGLLCSGPRVDVGVAGRGPDHLYRTAARRRRARR
jgi:hypothetical protein